MLDSCIAHRFLQRTEEDANILAHPYMYYVNRSKHEPHYCECLSKYRKP